MVEKKIISLESQGQLASAIEHTIESERERERACERASSLARQKSEVIICTLPFHDLFFLRFSFFSLVHFLHFFHILLKWLFSTHPRLVRDQKPFHFTHEQEDQQKTIENRKIENRMRLRFSKKLKFYTFTQAKYKLKICLCTFPHPCYQLKSESLFRKNSFLLKLLSVQNF
jgi:hypothetical protein